MPMRHLPLLRLPLLRPLRGRPLGLLALVLVLPTAGAAPLPFTQATRLALKRSRYELLIPAADRNAPWESLQVLFPERFDGVLIRGSVRLCRFVAPPAVARTRCEAVLPARIDSTVPGRLRVQPELPLDRTSLLGLSLLLFNPSLPGPHVLQLQASWASQAEPVTVGTWRIPIDLEDD